MEIQNKALVQKKLFRIWNFPLNWKTLAIAMLGMNAGILVFLGLLASSFPDLENRIGRMFEGIGHYPVVFSLFITSQFTTPDRIYIDINHSNLQRIEFERKRVLDKPGSDFSYVSARIRLNNQKAKSIDIRVKGDRAIHFDKLDTTSFRVKVKGQNTILGMKVFSLQKPRARNHIYEWTWLELQRLVGIITPRYLFVEVTRNGKNLGVFALEEHYDKHLVEAHGYKEGPIIRFDESTGTDFKTAQIVPFRFKKWTSPENLAITKRAVTLLESFRRGEISVSEAFDISQLANFLAISDIMIAHHGTIPKSLRFYYNPITARLQPIPFDGHYFTNSEKEELRIAPDYGLTEKETLHWIAKDYGDWYRLLFNTPDHYDQAFVRKYFGALDQLTSGETLDQMLEQIEEGLKRNLRILYKEIPLRDYVSSYGPGPFVFDQAVIRSQAQRIRDLLDSIRIDSYLSSFSDHKISFVVKISDARIPIEIVGLKCGGVYLPANRATPFLFETGKTAKPSSHQFDFLISATEAGTFNKLECQTLEYRIPGTKSIKESRILPWPQKTVEALTTAMPTPSALDRFSFLALDENAKTITIKQGQHRVTETIVIPPGYTLLAAEGTILELDNGAMLLSYSPVDLRGSSDEPIILTSSDGTGQGLTVMSAGATSLLSNVIIRDMGHPQRPYWELSGMVNFYESPIKANRVVFSGNNSEDALNIVRSTFELTSVSFFDTFSDALDIDFGSGSIVDSTFINSGNDAIDISGTTLELRNVSIDTAGDKGISVGERSFIKASNIRIRNAEFAIASKDSSSVEIDLITISNATVAITAYQKKPEFGPATINLSNLNYDGGGVFHLIELGSTLILDGLKFDGDKTKVEDLMYGVLYGKKSGE